jgi:hypothetical protein
MVLEYNTAIQIFSIIEFILREVEKVDPRIHHDPPGPTTIHHDPPGSTRIHQDPPRSTRIHQDPPRSTRTHYDPPGSTRTHHDPPGSTRTHQDPPGSAFTPLILRIPIRFDKISRRCRSALISDFITCLSE